MAFSFDAITLPSPLLRVSNPILDAAGVELWVKRDDLLHPEVSGNKWRKLQYNLLEMEKANQQGILTFGGAFSNHIYATAAAGKLLNFATIGIIRGEEHKPLNATLAFARSCGMKLYFVSRSAYRDPAKVLSTLNLPIEQYAILPEGGTNAWALPGCADLVLEVNNQMKDQLPDYWCLSCGTGGTLAGILTGLQGENQVLGFSALKGDFHRLDIAQLLQDNQYPAYENWDIRTDYHFGGYARYQDALIQFIRQFSRQHGIPLDPIYTGKLFYGIFDLVQKGFFPKGSRLLAIHTGGLQGNQGFEKRYGLSLS